jgi:hypothetical protein
MYIAAVIAAASSPVSVPFFSGLTFSVSSGLLKQTLQIYFENGRQVDKHGP